MYLIDTSFFIQEVEQLVVVPIFWLDTLGNIDVGVYFRELSVVVMRDVLLQLD